MDTRKHECLTTHHPNGTFGPMEKFCGLYFDGLLCWPATKAGEMVVQRCPFTEISYNIINTVENATKQCESDGTWFIHPLFNTTWANYSMCNLSMYDEETAVINLDVTLENSVIYTTWFPIMKSVSHAGYLISVITLLFSIYIFTTIKKLHCARNLLHVHLFISFILRALLYFIKEFVLIEGVALKSDVVMVNGKLEYLTEHNNWICKALTSSRNYFIQANYIFILMEGVYLHNLIYLNLFSEKSSIRIYYLLGWGIPLCFVMCWVVLRMEFDDTLCWTTSQNKLISKLIQGPIELSVAINFILFNIITRTLYRKINSMYLQQKTIKYRRLIRSTLTLVLIYAVPCAISTAVSYQKNQTVELVWIMCDQTFTAFQGLLMGFIYCILNGEVRNEVRHKYNSIRERHQQKRRSRTISTTQQFTIPLQEEQFVEASKQRLYKTTENL